VFELLRLSNTQLRTTMDGVIGFDYNAVFKVADCLNLKIDKYILDRVQRIERYEVERINARNR
jgi:hypothetical protein